MEDGISIRAMSAPDHALKCESRGIKPLPWGIGAFVEWTWLASWGIGAFVEWTSCCGDFRGKSLSRLATHTANPRLEATLATSNNNNNFKQNNKINNELRH